MSLLEKVKAGAQQAAGKTRDELHELQTRRELGQVHGELGQRLCRLAEQGEPVPAGLQELVDRAQRLKAELEEPTV